LFIFRKVAILGSGNFRFVIDLITVCVSVPEILIIAIPEVPGPVDKA
jgi:hypothetical protein